MDEESVSLHELLFSCYKDDLKLFTKYYLENNIINRRKDTVLIHSLAFASTEKLLKYKWNDQMNWRDKAKHTQFINLKDTAVKIEEKG